MPFRHSTRARVDLPIAAFVLAVICVVALQILLIASHDYFVDEWQALQIAVQSPDLPALFANLRYEGHPALWYLLLRGLGWLVGPAHALMAASLLCALATIGLIAMLAPLARWARLALILSEPLLFEFGTVSRGYSLGVMLTFAVLALWNRRAAFWCVLALLPLVDFIFGLMALGLIALRLSERGRETMLPWGAAVFIITSAAAAWSVVPASDFVSVYRPTSLLEEFNRWSVQLGTVALPFQWDGGPLWNAPWRTPFTPLLGALFLVVMIIQTRRRPIERLVAVGFPFALLAFMLGVHTLAIRHLMTSGVMFTVVLWRQGVAGIAMRRPTFIWLAVGAVCGAATAGFALSRPFDTAPETVRTIRSLGLENEAWISFPAQHGQGVSALSGIEFEGMELGCRQAFVRWNFRHKATDPRALRDWLTHEATQGGTFYLLSQYRPDPAATIHPIASITQGLDGKVYHLFRIEGAQPGRRAPVPPCVPGTRKMPPLMDD